MKFVGKVLYLGSIITLARMISAGEAELAHVAVAAVLILAGGVLTRLGSKAAPEENE